MKNFFSRGLAAIAAVFAPAFGLVRATLDAAAEPTVDDISADADATIKKPKRRGGYSGAKLERKAEKGRVGLATLR